MMAGVPKGDVENGGGDATVNACSVFHITIFDGTRITSGMDVRRLCCRAVTLLRRMTPLA
jgi:hypothetical protein